MLLQYPPFRGEEAAVGVVFDLGYLGAEPVVPVRGHLPGVPWGGHAELFLEFSYGLLLGGAEKRVRAAFGR
jgi:hypothetical protein